MKKPKNRSGNRNAKKPFTEPLTAYVADMSYFSGKMEAYLRYKEIPYNRKIVNVQVLIDEVYPHTRMMKVPVIRLPDGQWLKDTTPMIQWFEQEQPSFPVMPRAAAARFLALLLEDYADEWCWRSALYWRWCFPETRKHISHRIGHEVLADWPLPKSLAGWYYSHRQIKTYLKGDGLTRETEPFIRDHYTDMLDAMESILSRQAFLSGDKPGLVDFGFCGPFFRHFSLDPTPARVMLERSPSVYEWIARLWNARGSDHNKSRASFSDFKHPGWNYFFSDIATTYLPYLQENARAWQSGKKRFDFKTPSVTYRNLKVVHYRVYCLEMIQREFVDLSARDKARVQNRFAEIGDDFDPGQAIDSGLKEEFVLPLPPQNHRPGWMERIALTMTGTPWDLPGWLKPLKRD